MENMRWRTERLFFLLLILCPACKGAISLTGGESVYATFDSMSPSTLPISGWVIDHGTDKLTAGEEYHVAFFESKLSEIPVLERTIGTSSQNGISGFIFFGYDDLGHFDDFQGIVRIDMISGSLDIEHVTVVTVYDGQDYFARMTSYVPIPEPSMLGLAFLAGIICLAGSRRRIAN